MEDTKLSAIPFADMSRDDMIEHLRECHGFDPRAYGYDGWGSKVTKARMTEYHDASHAVVQWYSENPGTTDAAMLNWLQGQPKVFRERSHLRRTLPIQHDHVPVPVDEKVVAASKSLRADGNIGVTLLNAAERKALKDVVDNDFHILRQEMREMANQMERDAVAAVDAEWAERREARKDFLKKGEKAWAKYKATIKALTEDAEKAGVSLTGYIRYEPTFEAEVKGYKEAKQEAIQSAYKAFQRAELTMERQRLTAQRQVLLTGVTREASVVLDAIPDAKTLMVEAAKATAATQIEA